MSFWSLILSFEYREGMDVEAPSPRSRRCSRGDPGVALTMFW